MTPYSLGRAIRRIRKGRDMTLTEFARRMLVAVPTASDWERGRYQPRLSNIRRAARVLRCTLTDIIGDE